MENIFLETERIILRKMTNNDFNELALILKNKEIMAAWEYDFEDKDVHEWIKKNNEYYNRFNLGYFLAVDKTTNKIIGMAALMPDNINGQEYYEIGYILKREFQGKGFATEAAKRLAEYGFKNLKKDILIFEIRPENTRSRKVAEGLGAFVDGSFIKNVRGRSMEHLIYKLFMVNLK